ncbi:Leukocyte surface antigen cd53 [Sparganum proliferum]
MLMRFSRVLRSIEREPCNALHVAILIIAEVAICVVTLTKRTELGAAVESMVNRSFFEQFNDTTVQSAFDWMEDELDCCGVNDVSDYWKLHKPSNCQMESYTIVSSHKNFDTLIAGSRKE